MTATLRVNEIYRTIQGEGTRAGRPCTIIRLTGCNLRCDWCDTTYAYDEGEAMPVEAVFERVTAGPAGMVLVTGGEPLAQPAVLGLLTLLADAGGEVVLETNGSIDISPVDPRVTRIVDVKCPGSGEGESFLPANAAALRAGDELKFVLAGRGDYDFARRFLADRPPPRGCEVIFSPAAGRLGPRELAEWILADRLDVRLGIQLHRVIWPEADRGV